MSGSIILMVAYLINIVMVLSLIFIERKDIDSTWAWLLVMLLFPGFGFVFYLLLGQNLTKEKIFNEKKIKDQQMSKELIEDYKKEKRIQKLDDSYLDFIRFNFNNCGALYTSGNEVNIYTEGENKFKDLIMDIREAKNFIHIQYYIFRLDELGNLIINELKKKVDEGVEVRMLVDGMGSKSIRKKDIKYIEGLGIKTSIFFPRKTPFFSIRINYRNHRKIVVIDGKIGYVGGFNVGDEYVNKGKQFDYWRDTHIRIKGNAVNELNKRFILDWDYASEGELKDVKKYFPTQLSNGDIGMQIISSGPDNKEEYIKNAYMKMINSARKSVYIQTPYLVPDKSINEALKMAALSGIDVRIMVPGDPDHFFMDWILSANMGELLKSGVKIYRYEIGFIHAKTIVVDGILSTVGTANLDIRSFRLNFEINAFIYDEEFSKNMENIFREDISNCKIMNIIEYQNRGRLIRIKESLIRLISPLL